MDSRVLYLIFCILSVPASLGQRPEAYCACTRVPNALIIPRNPIFYLYFCVLWCDTSARNG